MAINEEFAPAHGKTIGDLALDACWFVFHSLAAVFIFGLVWAAMTISRPDPESISPKVFATALAFLVPMIAGFLLARIRPEDPRIHIARNVWISGLLFFAAVSLWVLDLPTGPGLCESCGAGEKLWRTFFDINHGSGLMGGDGLLVGTWVPLSMIGYATGATLALKI